jgi:segregation and condensation protein A
VLSPSFFLNNFEGPLELLLCLIQKEEIDICAIMLKELTLQMIRCLDQNTPVDLNSEILSLATTLLLLKSQKLLPREERIGLENREEELGIEMIQTLIEYSRLKETARTLALKEEEQKAFFPRATSLFRKELGSGLEEIHLEDLKARLIEVLQREEKEPPKKIQGEKWEVAHQISWLRSTLEGNPKLSLNELFCAGKCREELIVLFLALLELLKYQELKIFKENEALYIIKPGP